MFQDSYSSQYIINFIPGVDLLLQLELFKLAPSHLYPKFSLGCFETLQRNMRW